MSVVIIEAVHIYKGSEFLYLRRDDLSVRRKVTEILKSRKYYDVHFHTNGNIEIYNVGTSGRESIVLKSTRGWLYQIVELHDREGKMRQHAGDFAKILGEADFVVHT